MARHGWHDFKDAGQRISVDSVEPGPGSGAKSLQSVSSRDSKCREVYADEEWKALYEDAFHSFDQNGDGLLLGELSQKSHEFCIVLLLCHGPRLCKAEMQDAFFNWYGVRGKPLDSKGSSSLTH